MKRILSFALVLILCFALFACGDETTTDTTTTTKNNTTTTTTTTDDTTSTTTSTKPTTVTPDTNSSTTVKSEQSVTTTTTKKPTTTTTTKPTTSTTQAEGSVRGVIDAPRTETLTMYDIDPVTFQSIGKQEKTITYRGTIKVGNTSATSGTYGSIGAPFNYGIEAYLNNINFNGGIGGYYIEFVHYNDQYNGSTALTLTKKLVEHDKIFALVGQVGTPAVEATYDYIRQKGVISVGAFSNSEKLHTFALTLDEGAGIFPIHPVYYVEGQAIVGQMLGQHPDVRKIGILYTSDEVGTDIKDGAKEIISFLGAEYECVAVNFSSNNTSIASALNSVADCDALIVAANAQNVEKVLKGMISNNVYMPVFTSQVAATVSILLPIRSAYNALPAENKFPIYSSAWLSPYDVSGYLDFAEEIMNYENSNEYISNTYTMYGWMAADVFCTGLKRIVSSGKEITPENYIAAMESANVPLKMTSGGVLNYQAGGRFGSTTYMLLKSGKNCDGFNYIDEMKDYLAFVLLRDVTYIP